ncbi:hypothetical protein NHH82_12230 [Oxalobacteraceae bacterium OTU3REALA1]|nr:hypothetical protein NHH82_12230 [Oxalobacteraceae bacterium OTU3REALA1]
MPHAETIQSQGANIRITFRTPDHCPPHVHAFNRAQQWEFRVFFSYVSTEIAFEIKFGTPKKPHIEDVMNHVLNNLPKFRKNWWHVFGKVCLKNTYIKINKSGIASAAMPNDLGAIKLLTAKYDDIARSILFQQDGIVGCQVATCP